MTYFNTNELTTSELDAAAAVTGLQEQAVLALFRANKETAMTPEDVWHAAFTESSPLTSARRALTVLTTKGYLRKIPGATYEGSYGKPIHAWVLA